VAGHSLTIASTLQCPHGGAVQIVSTNVRASAEGPPLALATDTFVVAGCPFQIPAVVPIPSPCVTVQWLVPDTRVTVDGQPTLSRSSTGLCLSAAQVPQGPVVIANTQTAVRTL
jgi:hypothetical protein